MRQWLLLRIGSNYLSKNSLYKKSAVYIWHKPRNLNPSIFDKNQIFVRSINNSPKRIKKLWMNTNSNLKNLNTAKDNNKGS